MNAPQIEVTGTLQADGTLVLDRKVELPAGRVRVLVQAVELPPSRPQETLMDFLQRSRKELEAAGSRFMNDEEVAAHIEWLREGDFIDELLQQGQGKGE
jgi:hypothetical protein